MSKPAYITNREFTAADIEAGLPVAEYEQCNFYDLDLSRAVLSEARFIQCRFTRCNLSMAVCKNTAWQEVTFSECKLMGLRWDDAKPFSFAVYFDHCPLDFSSFHGCNLRHSTFTHCSLKEAAFIGADLTAVVLDNCDLRGAVFDRTILEKADFRTACHYTIDPENNRLRQAKFSHDGLAGLLGKYQLDIR